MRILFLLSDYVLPAVSGLRVRSLSQLALMAGLDAVEAITFLSLSEVPIPEKDVRALHERLPKVHVEQPLARVTRIRRDVGAAAHFLKRRILKRQPYLIAVNDYPPLHALVERHLLGGGYDVVYLGYFGMMAYLKDVRRLAPRARVVLEQHNLEWQIFDRLSRSMRPGLRELVKFEALAHRSYERKAMQSVDAVIAISVLDAGEFRALSGVEAIVVPPFVRPRAPRGADPENARLAYIGHLGWQPNAQGLDWFCRDVWPLVRARLPHTELSIAGPGLPQGPGGEPVVPPAWRQPGIRVVGFVDDLDAFYADHVGMIAPVIGGSGVRMKLLEALSAGMPSVTTGDGAAGLLVADGRELLIADLPQAFADGAVRLLTDPPLRQRLRTNGYAFLAAHHSEEQASERLRRALGLPN